MPVQTIARSFRHLVPHACIGAAIAAAGATAVTVQASGTDGLPAVGATDAAGTAPEVVSRTVAYLDDGIVMAPDQGPTPEFTYLATATRPESTYLATATRPEFTYLASAAPAGDAPTAPSAEDGEVIATTHVPLETWEEVARCESGYGGEPDWSINTGNGYYGGLQFALSSWEWVGGTGYPHEAPKATQIEMAERLWERQGWNAWPACSRKLGLR